MITEFIIKRSRWERGTGQGCLLNPKTKKQCCIGILLSGCGIPDHILQGQLHIEEAEQISPAIGFHLGEFYDINDKETLSEEQREKDLKEKFERAGIPVTFID